LSPYRTVHTAILVIAKQLINAASEKSFLLFGDHKNPGNALCGQNVNFLNIKPLGTLSNYRVLRI